MPTEIEEENPNFLSDAAALMKELLEEDSDSAPEEVTFSAGQKDAIESFKALQNQLRDAKAKLKSERRKLQERNIAQKEDKHQRLKVVQSKKLPDSILEQVSESNDETTAGSKSQKDKQNRKKSQKDDASAEVIQTDHKKPIPRTEEFISLHGTTEFRVSVLEDEIKKPKNAVDKILEFQKERLYGKRTKRESAQAFIGKRRKRIMSGHIKA